jgi:hypothetical protein
MVSMAALASQALMLWKVLVYCMCLDEPVVLSGAVEGTYVARAVEASMVLDCLDLRCY